MGCKLGVASLAILAATAAVLAKSPPIDCGKARGTVDMAICASAADVALDTEIAALYDRGLAELTGTDRHALAQSQVKFVHARAKCEWAAHNSAHPGPAVVECVRAKMNERVRLLRRTVDGGSRIADR